MWSRLLMNDDLLSSIWLQIFWPSVRLTAWYMVSLLTMGLPQGDFINIPTSSIYSIFRLNLVKNINFGLDQKKIFLTHWKTVFWVTEHFLIKWTFWKNAFFCPKNAFFWKKWQFDPLDSTGQRRCQGTFFPGGNFTPIFEAKK